eukprot:CAMPEP_0178902202 /NCGR_PEP_ID=MMETSP0786-20121207/4474_1 /TAXON_ID=186022 /ORGANISM="Thalassionema frauenfeldii, Strain CCMP 1798" /LENGTH=133 /DNA_ID=CAMNT_0020573443 /DNA_START=107 /DNA_END=508 /DNA_ORIENTATION=-
MEPISIPKPENKDAALSQHSGNLMLMEARYQELVSSIRALIRSNKELNDALVDTPNDTDFLEAVSENRGVILKQRTMLLKLVLDMRRQGADMDVPEDIVRESNEIQKEVIAASSPVVSQEAVDATSGEEGIYL